MTVVTEHSPDLTAAGGMLLPRADMCFPFGEAKFRLPRDAALLSWVFDQFLYGEVTGIQCGHWLYRAPSLEAATFFARQAVEELSHVRSIMKIYDLLGTRPSPAHPVLRLMTSMGADYAEHVALEMAVGEGLVLQVFYALIDTIDHPGIVRILEAAVKQEERHVAFGERQTMALLATDPGLRRRLLGLSLMSLEAMQRLGGWIKRRLGDGHEVLSQVEPFLGSLVQNTEKRLQRIGVLDRPLASLSLPAKALLIGEAQLRHLAVSLRPAPKLLTANYLADPALAALMAEGRGTAEVVR